MGIPFRLVPRPDARSATAFLLTSHAAEDVVRALAHLGGDPLPEAYRVADGFLLKLYAPLVRTVPGLIQLRELADNLLLPVDADLVPGLLAEEAVDLVRERGLIFLPGGRVLEFAPARPVSLANLLQGPPVRREAWRKLPRPPVLAERLREVRFELPEEAPEAILEPGGEQIGKEAPRPGDVPLPRRLAGKAGLGIGKGLGWLGALLGMESIVQAGANLAARALQQAPRLTEEMLGRQEAALRALLRLFQEGRTEEALRRAIPLQDTSSRGAEPHTGTQLPSHSSTYSLADLLRAGRVSGSVWMGAEQVYHQLRHAYRLEAEAAIRAGDYRRAAFIYGRLLYDFRKAAAVLSQGGLHHDAAILYLKKVGDPLAAAREFDAAGETDRALRLYRQQGEHELAGDLLRRMGDEEGAVAEYEAAVAKILATGGGYYQAGEVLLQRARRPDLALALYARGWAERPSANALPCATRLAAIHSQRESGEALLKLTSEVDQLLEHHGDDGPAAVFYNQLARLAEAPALDPVRDELRDRALVGLARRLRQRTEQGGASLDLVSTLFGESTAWSAALVSDARFATRRTGPSPVPVPTVSVSRPAFRIPARRPVVTASAWAPGLGEIFVGFESGEVYVFRPWSGELKGLLADHALLGVRSLAVSHQGEALVVLRAGDSPSLNLDVFRRDSQGELQHAYWDLFPRHGPAWLGPQVALEPELSLAHWDGTALHCFQGSRLVPEARWEVQPGPGAVLLTPSLRGERGTSALLFDGSVVRHYPNWPDQTGCEERPCAWSSTATQLACPPFSWVRRDKHTLEIAYLDTQGRVCWINLTFSATDPPQVLQRCTSETQAYHAVTLLRAGHLATTTSTGIHLLRAGNRRIEEYSRFDVSIPPAIACFPHVGKKELIVLGAGGMLVRVPLPSLAPR